MCNNRFSAIVIGLIGLTLLSCARATPASVNENPSVTRESDTSNNPAGIDKKSWEVKWEDALLKGRHEGKVVVIGSIAPRVRQAIFDAFNGKFSISMDVIPGSGSEVSERILRERRAGLYLEDIHLGGVVRVINQLAPAGAVESLDNILLLPEVTDPKAWWRNELPWIPDEKEHIFASFSAYVQEPLTINTQLVKPGEISAHRDLLNSKWKGKIIMNDASMPSSASAWFIRVAETLGTDYMKQLARQDVVVLRNERLILEWLAQNKYAVGIGIKNENALDFIEAGAPLDLIGTPETQWLTPGAGGLSLLRNAPHPNAAKVFINWFLSKEGQNVYSIAAGEQSARVDVPTQHLRPISVRQPGQKYFEDNIESIKKRDYYMNLAREIFGTTR